jgi:ABC-type sugar transport system ATPase subunit
MKTSPLVTMKGIRKSFGPVEVLHGVDFTLEPGEVHVLAGENGAGKSTLINILSGVFDDFSGELQVNGQPQRFVGPMHAARTGIATIHQELSLIPTMSVSDNMFLGREAGARYGLIDFARQESESECVLREMGLDAAPHTLVEELPIAGQQLLEIARALARDAHVIIFDEPTSALNEREVEILFERILRLRGRGRGIVYITHKMEEIYRLADRITVLRDGRSVGTATPDELPPDELVRWMVGRELNKQTRDHHASLGEVALEVTDLRVAHHEIPDRFLVDGVSFSVARGEIVGLAGLQGSGASELLHALFGAFGERVHGRVRFLGRPFTPTSPRESVAHGLVLLANDRKALGLAPEMQVVHNASLASLSRFCNRIGWVERNEEREAVDRLTGEFNLNAPSLDAPVRTLSGGNQQKVYLARCLMTEPRMLLLDEPTRGVDVGSKADIYRLMREWTDRGISILLITTEMEELLLLSDRILVLHRGRIAAEFARGEATKDSILTAAMGHANSAHAEEDE